MPSATFELAGVSMTPPYRIEIVAPSGARVSWVWATLAELQAWAADTESINDPEVILRWAIKKLRETDPDLSGLPGLVGRSFQYTTPSIELLPE
jgi:hypothetical protein